MTQPPPGQGLFRAAALAKIRSPEQLDALLPITSPLGWLALLTAAAAVAVIAIWACFGTIMRTVPGQGIIVRHSEHGIYAVTSNGTGLITGVFIKSGDRIKVGQKLFTIDLTELDEQRISASTTLDSLLSQSTSQEQDENERMGILQEKLANQQKLYDQGLLTKSPILDTRGAIYELQNRKFTRDQQIRDQRAKLKSLDVRIASEGVVRSSNEGEVIDVNLSEGDYVQPGRKLARLQSLSPDHEAVIFVSAIEGKNIRPGMSIRVSPTTIKPEEYGYILGTVESVSLYPVTRDMMMGYLENEVLVDRLLQGGEVISLTAVMEKDPHTPSGLKWSSSEGPDTFVEEGALCNASIVRSRQRPIVLLIPFLKKQVGLY